MVKIVANRHKIKKKFGLNRAQSRSREQLICKKSLKMAKIFFFVAVNFQGFIACFAEKKKIMEN